MINILKEKIIIPSWDIIQDDSNIKKYYLFPGMLSIIFLTILLVYQSIYTYVEIFWKKEEALIIILKFFHSWYITETIIGILIFLIIYFIIIPIYEWWLIKYIHKKHIWEEITTGEAFSQWIYSFFPIFEYNNFFSEFKIISILNGYLFTLRFIWFEFINNISYIFIILLFIWIVINILFSYSKYIILLEDKWVFKSIWLSCRITILNFKRTVKLYFIMLFLNLRIIFNFIIFLSFPIIFIIILWLITTKILLFLAITILIILFILLLLVIWYLTAVLEVFTSATWYFAYIEWKKKLEVLKEE